MKSNIKGDLFFFELEFCLKRDAFCKAYNEEGSLWDSLHNKQIECFHRIFFFEEGQQKIIEEAKAIWWIYFKRKKTFINSFDKNELSGVEFDFLREIISNI